MRLNPDTLGSPTATDEQQLAAALAKCKADDAAEAVKQAKGHLTQLKARVERTEAELAEHRANRELSTEVVLNRLKSDCPEAVAGTTVVGAWLWTTFKTKPDESVRKKLYALGFHWNFTRKCWQHPCGVHSTHTKGDPRFKYGATPVGDIVAEGNEIILTELSPTLKKIVSAVNNGGVLA